MNAKLEAHKLCTRDPIIGPGRQTKWPITIPNITRPSGPSAGSSKLQASSFRTNLLELQAASRKPRAASIKLQATSHKLSDPWTTEHVNKFRGPRTESLGYDECVVWMCLMPCNLVWWKFEFILSSNFQLYCEKVPRSIVTQQIRSTE